MTTLLDGALFDRALSVLVKPKIFRRLPLLVKKRVVQVVIERLGKTEAGIINLMGACAPTTFRDEILIPLLDSLGISYYDPYIKDYDEAKRNQYLEEETNALKNAVVTFMMIAGDGEPAHTRGWVSIIEAIHAILSGKAIILVMADQPEGVVIEGQPVGPVDRGITNEVRGVLRQLANMLQIPVFTSIHEAKWHIVKALLNPEPYRADKKELQRYLHTLGVDVRKNEPKVVRIEQDPVKAIEQLVKIVRDEFRHPVELEIRLPDRSKWGGMTFSDGTKLEGRLQEDLLRFVDPSFIKHLLCVPGVSVRICDHTGKLLNQNS